MRGYGKIIFVLMLSLALAGLSGCSDKEKASGTSDTGKKTVETKASKSAESKETAASSSDAGKKTISSTSDTGKKAEETKASKSTDSKEKASTSSDSGKKTAETKPSKGTDSKEKTPAKVSGNEEKAVHDLVLNDTKIVQISNISRRSNEEHPDLGPFFVVRGIDLRGQTSEVWIKDMKIYEMVTQNNK